MERVYNHHQFICRRNIIRINTILRVLAGQQRNKRSSCWCLKFSTIVILDYKQIQTQTQTQVMQSIDHVTLSLGRLRRLKIVRQKYTLGIEIITQSEAARKNYQRLSTKCLLTTDLMNKNLPPQSLLKVIYEHNIFIDQGRLFHSNAPLNLTHRCSRYLQMKI